MGSRINEEDKGRGETEKKMKRGKENREAGSRHPGSIYH